MNPLFQGLACFVVWAEAAATVTPEQVFGYRHRQVMQRASRLFPPTKSRALAGVLGLMLFSEPDFGECKQRLQEIDLTEWRKAIVPHGIDPVRLLKAISTESEARTLLAEMGLGDDSQVATMYSGFIAHPRALRHDIIGLLDEAWESGLASWWENSKHRIMGDGKPVTTSSWPKIPTVALAHGSHRVACADGGVILVPVESDAPARRKAVETVSEREPIAKSVSRGVKPAATAMDAEVFRGLADPTRIGILLELSKGVCYPSTLAQTLGVSNPTISHHLGVMKSAGLIKVRRSAGFREVSLNCSTIQHAAAALLRLCVKAEP